jgi:hypothetical protein
VNSAMPDSAPPLWLLSSSRVICLSRRGGLRLFSVVSGCFRLFQESSILARRPGSTLLENPLSNPPQTQLLTGQTPTAPAHRSSRRSSWMSTWEGWRDGRRMSHRGPGLCQTRFCGPECGPPPHSHKA